MRNILYYVSAVAVSGVILAGFAEAENPAAIQATDVAKKAEVLSSHADKKEFKEYFRKKQQKIEEKYEKAVGYVNETSLSDDKKMLLLKQAEESRDLALRQQEDRAALVEKHMAQKKSMMNGADTDRDVRKAMKKIKEILKK